MCIAPPFGEARVTIHLMSSLMHMCAGEPPLPPSKHTHEQPLSRAPVAAMVLGITKVALVL